MNKQLILWYARSSTWVSYKGIEKITLDTVSRYLNTKGYRATRPLIHKIKKIPRWRPMPITKAFLLSYFTRLDIKFLMSYNESIIQNSIWSSIEYGFNGKFSSSIWLRQARRTACLISSVLYSSSGTMKWVIGAQTWKLDLEHRFTNRIKHYP